MWQTSKLFYKTSIGLMVCALPNVWGCQTAAWFQEMGKIQTTKLVERTTIRATHHVNKGLKYAEHGKLAKAESEFRRAIEIAPNLATAHNNLGNLLLARHDLYNAAWEFQRAAELAPLSITPLINLGQVQEDADRLDEAANYYIQALELNPNDPIALGNLSRVRVKQDADSTAVSGLLSQLVYVDTRPEWVEWSEDLLSTRYRSNEWATPGADDSLNSTAPLLPQSAPLMIPESLSSEYVSGNPMDGVVIPVSPPENLPLPSSQGGMP